MDETVVISLGQEEEAIKLVLNPKQVPRTVPDVYVCSMWAQCTQVHWISKNALTPRHAQLVRCVHVRGTERAVRMRPLCLLSSLHIQSVRHGPPAVSDVPGAIVVNCIGQSCCVSPAAIPEPWTVLR